MSPQDGLAISYVFPYPSDNRTNVSSTFASTEHVLRWADMDCPDNDPVSRPVPVARQRPVDAGVFTRADSVVDAYANLFADYDREDDGYDDDDDDNNNNDDGDDETENDNDDGQQGSHRVGGIRPPSLGDLTSLSNIDAGPRRDVPWDMRGQTGLYGGGGRGADNRETGWVRDYAVLSKRTSLLGGGAEEELRHPEDAFPPPLQLRGAQNSSSERSSYGPSTPVSPVFDPVLVQHVHDVDVEDDRAARNTVNSIDAPTPPARPPRPLGLEAVPRKLCVTQVSEVAKGSPKLSEKFSRPSTPSAKVPLAALTVSAPFKPPTMISLPMLDSRGEVKRRKSLAQTLRWTKTKKTPAISNPILPDGFVESLGMETFSLPVSPATVPVASNKALLKKGTLRSKKTSSTPAAKVITVVRQPELVRTPLDALRDVGANTPVASSTSTGTSVMHRQRPHSHASSSSAPSTIAAGHYYHNGATSVAIDSPVASRAVVRSPPILSTSKADQPPSHGAHPPYLDGAGDPLVAPRGCVTSPVDIPEDVYDGEESSRRLQPQGQVSWSGDMKKSRTSVESVSTDGSRSNYLPSGGEGLRDTKDGRSGDDNDDDDAYYSYYSSADRSNDDNASEHSNFSLDDENDRGRGYVSHDNAKDPYPSVSLTRSNVSAAGVEVPAISATFRRTAEEVRREEHDDGDTTASSQRGSYGEAFRGANYSSVYSVTTSHYNARDSGEQKRPVSSSSSVFNTATGPTSAYHHQHEDQARRQQRNHEPIMYIPAPVFGLSGEPSPFRNPFQLCPATESSSVRRHGWQ